MKTNPTAHDQSHSWRCSPPNFQPVAQVDRGVVIPKPRNTKKKTAYTYWEQLGCASPFRTTSPPPRPPSSPRRNQARLSLNVIWLSVVFLSTLEKYKAFFAHPCQRAQTQDVREERTRNENDKRRADKIQDNDDDTEKNSNVPCCTCGSAPEHNMNHTRRGGGKGGMIVRLEKLDDLQRRMPLPNPTKHERYFIDRIATKRMTSKSIPKERACVKRKQLGQDLRLLPPLLLLLFISYTKKKRTEPNQTKNRTGQ